LITGGLGFIGSSLAKKLLSLGAKVTIVDSLYPQFGGNRFNIAGFEDKFDVHYFDINESERLQEIIIGKDILFNLAGQTSHLDSMLNPFLDLEINVKSQISILESCRKINPCVKIVFASTRQIYGRPQYLPVDESHPIKPVDVNGINKVAGENYHLLYNQVYGIKSTALRLTNTYGPGMRVKDARQTFLGVWLRSVVEGEVIKVFGDGSQLRDFNYVDDCVDAFLIAGVDDRSNGKAFNLGSSEVVSLSRLASALVDLEPSATWGTIPFPQDRKNIDIGDYYSDYSMFASQFGWAPKVNLFEGLSRSLDFYRKNLHNYI